MIVVSDTSALTSLLQIGLEDILREVFGRVVIPEAVERELRYDHPVLPPFVQIARVADARLVDRLSRTLDLGEAEAMALVIEGCGDILLIDERKGRRIALEEGVPVIGLLGVLIEGKRRGLIPSLRATLTTLQTTAGFRISDALISRALKETGEI